MSTEIRDLLETLNDMHLQMLDGKAVYAPKTIGTVISILKSLDDSKIPLRKKLDKKRVEEALAKTSSQIPLFGSLNNAAKK